MSKKRKLRSDSKFTQLSPQQHDSLVSWLTVDRLGYEEITKRLKNEFDFEVSVSALGDFYRNHCWLNRIQASANLAEEHAGNLKFDPSKFDTVFIAAVKQQIFELASSGNADPKELSFLFKMISENAKLELDREKLTLESAKFKRTTAELFLEFYANQKALEIAANAETKEVKVEQLAQLMFGNKPNNLLYA